NNHLLIAVYMAQSHSPSFPNSVWERKAGNSVSRPARSRETEFREKGSQTKVWEQKKFARPPVNSLDSGPYCKLASHAGLPYCCCSGPGRAVAAADLGGGEKAHPTLAHGGAVL